jgi:hypothetical protein
MSVSILINSTDELLTFVGEFRGENVTLKIIFAPDMGVEEHCLQAREFTFPMIQKNPYDCEIKIVSCLSALIFSSSRVFVLC